jgi:hypothetical protein
MKMRLTLWVLFGLLICCGCAPVSDCNTAACTRVLFVGNSYTFVNDLPGTFAALARAGGHSVEIGMVAQGGWMLADHLKSKETLDRIQSAKWNYVVLQEQSEVPSVEGSRAEYMRPAAAALINQIEDIGARPVLFMTWAHRNGYPQSGMPDYAAMQAQINYGYLGISQQMKVPVAPVGVAWSIVYSQNPALELWQEDDSHPAEAGTYLAACVFYATLFRQSPEGLTIQTHLSKETVQILQTAAAHTVLDDTKAWNLPLQ